MKYPELSEKFCKWFEKEYTYVWEEWHGENISEEMLAEMKLSDEDYFDMYIRPYLKLPEEQLRTTLNILGSYLKDKLTPQPSPFCLTMQFVVSPKINALEWLLVHIADLKYFEFNDFIKNKYKKPYKQCLICGKPDFYERLITKSDKKEKRFEFSSKEKYCHVCGCTEDSSNPREHVKGCHYKEWAYIKKSMNQKLSRYLEKLKKLNKDKKIAPNTEGVEEINEKITQTESAFFTTFKNFYTEQYKKNLKIQYTVRAKGCKVFNLNEF